MENPGVGYRTVVSLAMEMSLQLVQPIVYTPLLNSFSSGLQTAEIASTDSLYPGALLVVDSGANAEVVTVISVTTAGSPPGPAFTATFAESHVAGVLVQGGTFPVQAITDPLFTTAEILGYIARAQNEFLAEVPCIFALSHQTVNVGQMLQSAPATTIEMERVAAVNTILTLTSMTRAIGVVTAVSSTPHGYSTGSAFSIISATDTTFIGAFQVATVIDQYTFTYQQSTADATTSGTAGLWSRLYEVSQQELTNQQPSWRTQSITALKSWYEDRQGLYGWGCNGVPASNFPVELLCSIRDTDTLGLLDGFLLPDVVLHGVRYLALSYAWSKDGEMQDQSRAKFCKMRADRVILATQRFLSGMGLIPPMQSSGGRRA